MNAAARPRPSGAVLYDIGLGIVFALGIAFTTGSGLRVFDNARPDRNHRSAAGRRPYP